MRAHTRQSKKPGLEQGLKTEISRVICTRASGSSLNEENIKVILAPFSFSRRPNQSILKEISPEYSLEGLMLKLQYFGHQMQRTDSLEKTLMLGKVEGKRRRDDRG